MSGSAARVDAAGGRGALPGMRGGAPVREGRDVPVAAARGRAPAVRAVGHRREAPGARVRRRWRPTSTGSGRFSTTAATVSRTARAPKYELLLSAARPHDHARPVLQRSPTGSVRFSSAKRYPGGPAVPTRRSRCSRRASTAQPQKWQYLHDIGVRPLLAPARSGGGRRSGSRKQPAMPDAPNWLRPLAATHAECEQIGGRRASCGTRSCSPTSVAAPHGTADPCCSSTRSIRSTSCRRSCATPRFRPASAVVWEDLVRRRLLPGVPVDPTGMPYRARSRHACGDAGHGVHPVPAAGSGPPGPPAAPMTPDDDRRARPRVPRVPRPRDRQLPQRVHPPAAVAASVVSPGSRCPRAAMRCVVRQHPGRQLRRARRPLPLVPGADLDPLSDRRTDHAGRLPAALLRDSA